MRFTPRFSITNAIAAALTEIERARGFLDAASLSDEWIDSMRSRAFLLEAHHTTHIEGTRLTIEEAADLLAGDDVPGADPDDTRELLNYRDAFEFVSTYLNDGGPITERLILDAAGADQPLHLQVQILVLRLSHRDPGVTVQRHPSAPLAGIPEV